MIPHHTESVDIACNAQDFTLSLKQHGHDDGVHIKPKMCKRDVMPQNFAVSFRRPSIF